MEINQMLENFSKECGEKLNLKCILQFGSSTYSKKPDDIDLAFFSNKKIFPTKDYLKLFEIIKKYEKRREIVFDIAGGKRKRNAKYSVSIIPVQNIDLKLNVDPFFFKNLSEDKNKKALFGKDPTNIKVKLNKRKIAERLINEIDMGLRDYLEPKNKKESMRTLFKTTLRLMLTNYGVAKKENLLSTFKEKFNLKVPKNSEKIIKGEISENDCKEILKFAEECLRHLSKNL